MVFQRINIARSLGRCRKPRPSASVFNTSQGTWRMLMHEKTCLIPIITSHGGTVALSYIQTEKKCNRGTTLNRLAETSTGGGGGGGGN